MKNFLILLLSLFVVACANQGNITGGEKDEAPPVLENSIPENGTLNFTSNSFELFFNENIKVKDLNKNLLVSPFLEKKPKIKIRPRSIVIELQEDLQPNTTYSFNFGNAIQDLNEGNELAGFTYVFSTGEELDSASLSGSAILSETGLFPEKGAWALLYSSIEDSLFTTTSPDYATPIQEDGHFHFQNVKDGKYRLFALRDNNFNYYYDLPNEEIAFTDSLIFVQGNQFTFEPLQLFTTPIERGFVKKSIIDKYQSLLIETSVHPKRFNFQFQPDVMPSSFVQHEDSIRFWFKNDQVLPNSAFVLLDNQLIDTIKFRKKEFELKDSIFKVYINNEDPFIHKNPLYLSSKIPFELSGDVEPVLLEDSLYVAGGVELIKDTLNATKAYLKYNWKYGKSYILTFDDSTFVNVFNLPSDSLQFEFKVPKKEDLSVLNLSFITQKFANQPLIFQLYEGDDLFIEEEVGEDMSISLTDLPAKKYTSRIIVDTNGNGQWDSGSYEEKRQPEKVLTFETEIELRANWDLDVQINLDE